MDIALQGREAEIAAKLAKLMLQCDSVEASSTAVVSELKTIQAAIADFAFNIVQQEGTICDDENSEDADAVASRKEALESHRAQLKHFMKQAARLKAKAAGPRTQLPAAQAEGTSPSDPRPGTANNPTSQLLSGGSAKAVSRVGALRSSRDILELELQRMAAANDLLQKDGAMLEKTHAEHVGYSGDMQTAGATVSRYANREARDRLHIRLAFGVFVIVASYVMARRVLWTFLGIRLPGL